MTPDTHDFAAVVMSRYCLRPEAAADILTHRDVTVLYPNGVIGGSLWA